MWNEGRIEWISKIHREKKVGELVGWIKRHLCVSKKDGETKVKIKLIKDRFVC